MKRFDYGGQAVLEGVMMRGENTCAVAVRKPDGQISIRQEPLNPTIYQSRILKLPVLRGLRMLADSLGIGMRALFWSADVAVGEEQPGAKFSGPVAWGTVALSLAFGVGLFFLLPAFITGLIDRAITSAFLSNLLEGLIRLAIVIGYLALTGLMPDMRHVYAYHGAEHKTINAYEAGAELTPDSVARYSTAHTRCGTGFLLVVLVIFIILSTFFGRPALPLRLLTRLLLIPLVAGIAYEWVKFSAHHYQSSKLIRILAAPGLALQKLTTRQPEPAMLEVSIAALQTVLASQVAATAAPESISVIEPTEE
ncbi:MAG: DUF1385 domain-containing protein [Chloroflexi bacterium]|nr:DUF1385 domain-containing protein [Chloroflexota bacterium]